MKKHPYIIIGMLLISTLTLATTTLAHPPQDMTLTYDLGTTTLNVTITHESPAPTVHYIETVEIKLNDVLYDTYDYTSQPTNDIFTYSYTVIGSIGDVIEVTSICNIQGSITRTITITDPSQDDPPLVEIKNPVKGYFHFSGVRLFATYLDIIDDTMGFGGFRVRPVQIFTDDDNDQSQDLTVNVYIDDELRGEATWNPDTQYHEIKWTGPALGVFTLKATAEDSFGNIASTEMDLWYFCFIPE